MHTYILRGKYSPEAFDGMLNDPSDRAPAAQALVEAIGGKMLVFVSSLPSLGNVTNLSSAAVRRARSGARA